MTVFLFPTIAHDWGRVVPEFCGRQHEIFAVAERLDQLASADQVVDATQRALGRFGIETCFYAALPRAREGIEDVLLACRVPPGFLSIARERQYIRVSPAIRHCRRTVQPFVWSSAPYDPEREPLASELVGLVNDFRMADAVMVPIPGPAGCEGAAWFGGAKLEHSASQMPMVHFLALYAFDRIRTLHYRTSLSKPMVTAREREVLTWVAIGKSAWEVGEILNIAKRTVDEHIQTAMRKLGAVNRTQAVTIALRDRLISPDC